jgi:hypothetical protein
MKKLIIAILGFALIIGTVSAWGLMPGNGNGQPQFINLTEKDSTVVADNGAWGWVLDGGFGKLMYKATPKPMFVFNAGNMTADTEYALISYAEPWNIKPSNVLGFATSDATGNVTIADKSDVTTKFICNSYPTDTSDEYLTSGVKIWLVPTSDFDMATGMFTTWDSTKYLFETDLINPGCEVPV